jgi:hypothetical protein
VRYVLSGVAQGIERAVDFRMTLGGWSIDGGGMAGCRCNRCGR